MKKILKKLFKLILILILLALLFLLGIFLWHKVANFFTKGSIEIPGDQIEVYKEEYIHSVKMGEGDYTIVFLPGMGTPSPYYDYYNLAKEVAKKNRVIIIEPLGYGFSDDTEEKRGLNNYEHELSAVLEYYNIKDNIILLGHSYSGISNLYYANRHNEIKGIICLDCTTAYQIETHVENGSFIEEPEETPMYYTWLSPSGLTRFAASTFMAKDIKKELLVDIPSEYKSITKYLLYNRALNKTIIREIDDIYYNQLAILNEKYRENLYVRTILSNDTIESMKKYKEDGDFKKDWEEMHNALISNEEIQKIFTLDGDHYIHHGNVSEVTEIINTMVYEIDKKE